ncbi:hypothetical protein AB4Y90_00365 [Chryseobacterium sp. 2TAF14]|uniref:hypothetical protein n=1 Tax=Chryseobacterium sp. 2TAF14 TaxID=3233007 RepID=UPI003F8EE237
MKKNILLLLLLAIISCKNSSQKIYKDFHFEYWKEEDHYNSENGLFTRNYAANEQAKRSDSIRNITLNKEEITKIIKGLEQYSILELPSEFSCNILSIRDPKFVHVNISINGNYKEFLFKYNRSNPDIKCTKGKRIINFSKILDSIIYNKKSIRDLPQTNLYYE